MRKRGGKIRFEGVVGGGTVRRYGLLTLMASYGLLPSGLSAFFTAFRFASISDLLFFPEYNLDHQNKN